MFMSTKISRSYTVSDLKDEILYFNKHWKRSFSGSKAVYTATSDYATIKLTTVTPRGKLIPQLLLIFKKGSRVVVIDTALHIPPHATVQL